MAYRKHDDQITFGELLEQLYEIDDRTIVRFSDRVPVEGFLDSPWNSIEGDWRESAWYYPSHVESYRGDYRDIAIRPQSDVQTVHGFLEGMRTIVQEGEPVLDDNHEIRPDASVYGYKGGRYGISEETPLWAADRGDASHLAIVGMSTQEDDDGIKELVLELKTVPP